MVDDRDVTLLVVAFLALALTVGLLVFNLVVVERNSSEAAATHQAVCQYDRQLQDQVRSSLKYLAQHPAGAPALGISASQIRSGVAKEQAEIQALSDLNCAPLRN